MTGTPLISATRSAAIAAPPHTVIDLVADPRRLPEWAPAFAARVEERGGGVWTVATGPGPGRDIRVRRSDALGVVDFVSVGQPDRGAFLRVLRDGPGSHVTFTIVFPAEADPEAVAEEMRGVEQELAALGELLAP
ncbi:SRPBCC family protein [Nocardioides sp. 503]|uniref:SRPBCC family protein n=1 Tax=Nocardioides sp. 503 TaxID=2508326 RepID=UPI00106F8819|nr:SRPBCC family protein [Nocardioides sp. 503]